MDLNSFAPYVQNRINIFLQNALLAYDDSVKPLKETLSYGLLLGGKRSRPLLVYATGNMFKVKDEVLDYVAAAIECIHAYSLIHDDMPEMDNDRYRRGHETVHVKFGQDMALLAGDTLQSMAFELLSSEKFSLEPEQKIKLVSILSTAAGYLGMCGGQALDLLSENKHINLDALRLLHSKKTGALIKAAVMMGAFCYRDLNEFDRSALERYASYTGLAFQVWDDVLDIEGDMNKTGKAVGADIALGKSTYPALMGLDNAKCYAHEIANKAILSLEGIDADCSLLKEFALFTVNRDH